MSILRFIIFSIVILISGLSRGEDSSEIHLVGAFGIEFQIDAESQQLGVQIREIASNKIFYQSPEKSSFIEALLGVTTIKMNRGSFSRSYKNIKVCEKIKIESQLATSEVVTLAGRFVGCEADFKLSFYEDLDDTLSMSAELTPLRSPRNKRHSWNLRMNWKSHPDEKMLGFGEQFTRLNMKGSKLPIISAEQGHGRSLIQPNGLLNRLSGGGVGQWYSTYASIPQFISSQNYAFYSTNYEFMEFDFTQKDRSSLQINALNLDVGIIAKENPLDLIEVYTDFSGRMKALPNWAHKGPIIALMGGSDEVRRQVEKLDSADVPYTSLWIQDWPGIRKTPTGDRVWWNWEVDRNHYPDWESIIASQAERDVTVMSYINPFLVEIESSSNFEKSYFDEAKKRNLLLRDSKGSIVFVGQVGFRAALLDLSNPGARDFIKRIIKREIIDKGIRGWMADFSEAVPFNVEPYNGMSAQKYHHWYIEQWAQINRSVISELDLEGQAVFMMRAGFTRSPRYNTLAWVGDQLVTWDEHDGLKSSLRALISGGISGLSINHSDIGGAIEFNILNIFKFLRTKQLMQRWIELNAFTPVMRTHVGIAGKNSGHQIYSSEDTMKFFAKFSRIFASLVHYREELMKEAETKGHPMMRHMALMYPNDKNCWELTDQYMFGSKMLVAPVMDPDKTEARAYLPKGDWVHIWSGKRYEIKAGEWIEQIPAPIGQPPVFVKSGSKLESILKKHR